MSAEWERRRMRQAYLATIPYGLRQQMQEQGVTMMGVKRPLVEGRAEGVAAVRTSPGGEDNHTHIAYLDDSGNGVTSVDHGEVSSTSLPTNFPTPDYTGEL
jgi:hypothetical protein